MLILPLLAAAADLGVTLAEAERAATALHERLDGDHDGYVTYAEARDGGLALIMPKAAADLAAKGVTIPDLPAEHIEFDRADTNHDGRLSLTEDLTAVRHTFAEMDTDQDGKVSPTERMAYLQPYLQRMQRELAALPKPPCATGAACEHLRN